MEKNCPYCGTKLMETNMGRYHCPNHGIINTEDDSEESNENPNYIG